MTIFQAELKYYLRSPMIWLIAALSAFVAAWSYLLSIELFSSLQVKFAGMSDAPTIIQGVIYPVLNAQSKIMIVIVAIISGLSFSRLYASNTWLLIINAQYSDTKIIWQKYLSLLVIALLFIAPTVVAVLSLTVMANLELVAVLMAIIGLLLLIMWMLSVAMWISSFVNNIGFAILLAMVFFMLMWMLSQASLDASWGKNWLQVMTPFYHFQQFLSHKINYASWFYFIVGIVLSLWLTKIRLTQKRYSL